MDLVDVWQDLLARLASTPLVLFFLALVVLPLGPFPASVLFIAAGARFGTVGGFAVAFLAMSLNVTLAYLLARRALRHPLERWLRKRGREIPTFDPGDEIRFLLLFRITPGLPLFLQNYVLGLSGVRFALYLPVTLVVQVPYILGFVWFGQSLTQTSGWRIGVGIAGLVALFLLVSLVRHFLERRRARRQA